MVVAGFDRYDLHNTPMTDGATFTIWFAGCTHGCRGCQNVELWDANNGEYFSPYDIVDLIIKETKKTRIRTATLLGGEPLQQDIEELSTLCNMLSLLGFKIWLYTGYEFEDVPDCVLRNIDYVKCGKYVESLRIDGRFPITTNQRVYQKCNGDWILLNKEE